MMLASVGCTDIGETNAADDRLGKTGIAASYESA